MEPLLTEGCARGDQVGVTWVGLAEHGFTPIDSPRRMRPSGPSSSAVPLDATIGKAPAIRFDDVPEHAPIDTDLLAARGAHVGPGDIVLLRTRQDERRRLHGPEVWTEAPWLTHTACTWLLAHPIKALAPHVPQHYSIRRLLGRQMAPMEDFVSHDMLLRHGVISIEDVCNVGALRTDRATVYALPRTLSDSDSCPPRVIPVESD